MKDKDEILSEWVKTQKEISSLKEHLENLKNKEELLRFEVLRLFFNLNVNELRQGTQYYNLGNNYQLKGVFSIDLKVKKGPYWDKLKKAGESFSGGADMVKNLIRHKPEVCKNTYDQLPQKVQLILSDIIEIQPNNPQLEFIEPK